MAPWQPRRPQRGLAALILAAAATLGTAVAPAGAPAAESGPAPPTLPSDLGPVVSVGVAVGPSAPAAVTVSAIPDPDAPVSAAPALVAGVAPSAASANQAAAAALTDAAGSAPGGGVAAQPLASAASSVWFAAVGPQPLAVVARGLSPQAASALAATVAGAAAVAIGPGGESVLAPASVAAATPTAQAAAGTSAPAPPALWLSPAGVLAGPFPTAAAAEVAVGRLTAAGLWAVAALALAPGGSGDAWYARALAPTSSAAVVPDAAAVARLAQAAAAALGPGGAPVVAVPAATAGAATLVAAGGEAALAPAAWVAPAPGALSVAASGGAAVGSGATAYAGALAVSRPGVGSGLWVVNDVALERYVAGVVPREMPASWPQAALEAQAIACRTYALWAATTRDANAPYVLAATAQDQVYGGLGAETAATDAATWATAGEVLTYAGRPIDAMYEPDSGGYTAASVDVWGNSLPYLAAVPEPRGYRPLVWREVRSDAELRSEARIATGVDPGAVDAVVPSTRAAVGGRVLRLVVEGVRASVVLTDDAVRTALDLPSNLFHLSTPTQVWVEGAAATRRVLGLEGLTALGAASDRALTVGSSETLVGAAGATRAVAATPPWYAFIGSGEGPGLGMSQYGALYMAGQGESARAILLYYYRGVELSRWYGEGSA